MLSNNESIAQNDNVSLASTIIWKNNGFRLPVHCKSTNENLSIDKDIHPIFVRLPSISLNGKSTPCLKAALARVASLSSQLTPNTTTYNYPIKMAKPIGISSIKSPTKQPTKAIELLDADDEFDVVAMVPPKVDRKTAHSTKKKRKGNNDHFVDLEDEERTKALVQRLKLNTNTLPSTKTIAPNDEISKIKAIGPYLRMPCSQPQKILLNGSLNKIKLVLDIPKTTTSSTATRALISREMQAANSLTSVPIVCTPKTDQASKMISVFSTLTPSTSSVIATVTYAGKVDHMTPRAHIHLNSALTNPILGSRPGSGKPVIYSINNRRMVSLLETRPKTPLNPHPNNHSHDSDGIRSSWAFTHFATCQEGWLCAFCCRSAYGSVDKPNLSLGELFGPLLVKIEISQTVAPHLPCPPTSTPKKVKIATMVQRGSDDHNYNIKNDVTSGCEAGGGDAFPFKVYLHRPCVIWASSVGFGPNGFLKLDQAILQAAQTNCSICKSKGANIRCSTESCPMWFHYACGLYADFLFEQSTYTAYCAQHKNQRIEIMKY